MVTTMDRYESDWSIVERGYKAHVLGEGRRFPSARDAIETVQLYVGALASAVPRAPRELEAFAQVELAAGVRETISFDLPIAELAYYDVESLAWVVEPTEYQLEVGSSSEDLPLSAVITIEGP